MYALKRMGSHSEMGNVENSLARRFARRSNDGGCRFDVLIIVVILAVPLVGVMPGGLRMIRHYDEETQPRAAASPIIVSKPGPTPAPIIMKSPPAGSGMVVAVEDPKLANEPCWTDPNISFVLLRRAWSVVEPTQGSYNWAYFDEGLGLAEAHGKRVQMSINCGVKAPAWLYTLGAQKWTTTGHIHGLQSQPAPWDAVFQKRLSALISAWGARYDSNPLVASVTLWAGGRGIETFFAYEPQDAQALDAVGGVGIWTTAAENVIDEYRTAWPTTPLYLACGENYLDQRISMTQVARYALAKGIGLQTCALSATYPFYNHAKRAAFWPHTNIDLTILKPEQKGAQLLMPVGNPRMKGATVAQVAANATQFKIGWVQWYPNDPAKDEVAIAAYNQALKL
jgi:Beta-galactosidase